MLPPFIGALLFLATAGIVALALVVAVWSRIRGDRVLSRRALLAGGLMALVYLGFWTLGLGLARTTLLPPGESLSFCGLDCHLHVSVAGVRRDSDLGVTVRFTSNARQAPEWPGKLQFRLLDGSGKEFAPLNEVPDSMLRAGESWMHELRFPAGANAARAALLVSWKPGLDYFVPGAGNPLVQRRRRLALSAATGTGG